MTSRVIENPPPGKTGETYITVIEDDTSPFNILTINNPSRLVDLGPYYTVVGTTTNTVVENVSAPTPIVVNAPVNDISSTLSSDYESTTTITNINSNTQLTNDGLGSSTFEDIIPPIWNTTNNTIIVYNEKEIIEVQLRLTATTDTLGGAFELSLVTNATSNVIDKQEFNINIQQQDYTVTFKFVTTLDDVISGVSIFVQPELGMVLNLTQVEFLFFRTIQTS